MQVKLDRKAHFFETNKTAIEISINNELLMRRNTMDIIKDGIVVELYEAYLQKKPIICYSDRDIDINKEDGYDIQNFVVRKKVKQNNESIKGYKIGLTTVETQKLYNTNEPFYGIFTEKNIVYNSELNLSDMFDPKVTEIEVIFFIDEDINQFDDEQEIVSKTRIGIGIEVPDSRYINWFRSTIPLGVVIADSGVAGKVIVGQPKDYSLEELNKLESELFVNDEKIDSGKSAEVLGSPINTMLWLVNKLAERGQSLKKGMIVSSGSMTMPKPIKKGTYKVKFSNFGEMEVVVK